MSILSKAFVFFGIIIVFAFIALNWPLKKEAVQQEKPAVSLSVEMIAPEEIPLSCAQEAPEEELASESIPSLPSRTNEDLLPQDDDRINELFNPFPATLPIVETVTYAGRVSWLAGRAAYLGDYASHYQTSKHFISRSLHGPGQYFSDKVSKGDRFNVFRLDKDIEFHLVLDLSRLKMWFYYLDVGQNQRLLLKTYRASAGRIDPSCRSSCLTPTGIYLLGNEIAVYKEGTMGRFQNELIEMVSVFGKRWLPLGKEIADCTAPAKGLGIHGVPWQRDPESGQLVEIRHTIGKYVSSGCIRLLTEDIEELFAIVASKPTYVHIVSDFFDAQLPGKNLSH